MSTERRPSPSLEALFSAGQIGSPLFTGKKLENPINSRCEWAGFLMARPAKILSLTQNELQSISTSVLRVQGHATGTES